jgi:hypothetical protein
VSSDNHGEPIRGCANTLAGIAAGADHVSGTVTGLGERCGSAALEEVALAAEVLDLPLDICARGRILNLNLKFVLPRKR